MVHRRGNKPPKGEIAEAARKLRSRDDWNPDRVLGARESPEEQLSREVAELRSESTYRKATDCKPCARARVEMADETALCEKHLAAALGG